MKYNPFRFLGYLWLSAGIAGVVINDIQNDNFGTIVAFIVLGIGAFTLAWEKE